MALYWLNGDQSLEDQIESDIVIDLCFVLPRSFGSKYLSELAGERSVSAYTVSANSSYVPSRDFPFDKLSRHRVCYFCEKRRRLQKVWHLRTEINWLTHLFFFCYKDFTSELSNQIIKQLTTSNATTQFHWDRL